MTTDAEGVIAASSTGTVGAANFVWVVSDGTQTEAAAAPVFAKNLEYEPPAPGVWVAPEAGMVPATFPICEVPPWDSDTCTPPSEWHLLAEVNWETRPREVPRQTAEVASWDQWCRGRMHRETCRTLLGNMKWALDYLGAHPACVLSEYAARVTDLQSDSSLNSAIDDESGWHNCATVIDPLLSGAPEGRSHDIGWRLSDTGLSLAERCRAVLPSDVQLETGVAYSRSPTGYDPPTEFAAGHAGCDGWASYVAGRRTSESYPSCTSSALLAEEWMEHHHGTPTLYRSPWC